MDIKLRKFLFFTLLLMYLQIADATKKILVERYEKFNHPILAVFKEYGIIPYKIDYSVNKTCPIIYAKFRYSSDVRAPNANDFHRVYFKAFEANSYFPYILIDQEENFQMNVGWINKAKNIFKVDIYDAVPITTCKTGR